MVDTSAVVDHLVAGETHFDTQPYLESGFAAAPDVVVFEVLSALRRSERRGNVDSARAQAAVLDLADLSLELFPSMPLRGRAWALRENLTAADALFVALAEDLNEPLVTRDRRMAIAAREQTGIETIVLGG